MDPAGGLAPYPRYKLAVRTRRRHGPLLWQIMDPPRLNYLTLGIIFTEQFHKMHGARFRLEI